MGRKKSYDERQVLSILAREFATNGFEATSIDRIATTTGMKRGSIYQAFDSKANLFRLAFRHAMEHREDAGLLTDLLIVGLWERANTDVHVRETAREVIAHLEQSSGEALATIFEQRLLQRAGLIEQ